MENLGKEAREQRRLAYERIINLEKKIVKDAIKNKCKVYAFDGKLHRVIENQQINKLSRIIVLCREIQLIKEYVTQLNSACDEYDETLEDQHIKSRRPQFHTETIANRVKYSTYDAFSSTKTTADKLLASLEIKIQILDDPEKIKYAKEDIRTIEEHIARNGNSAALRARRYSGTGLKLRIVDGINKSKNFSISEIIFCLSDEKAIVEKAEDRMSPNSKMLHERLFYLTTLGVDVYPA